MSRKTQGAQSPDAIVLGTLRLTSAQDVRDLLDDLRSALRRSQRTGGAYSVYRRADDGAYLLAVEIHVAAESSPRRRKGGRR